MNNKYLVLAVSTALLQATLSAALPRILFGNPSVEATVATELTKDALITAREIEFATDITKAIATTATVASVIYFPELVHKIEELIQKTRSYVAERFFSHIQLWDEDHNTGSKALAAGVVLFSAAVAKATPALVGTTPVVAVV